MQSLTSAYGIDFALFKETIIRTKSLVAGSTPLAMYLKQEGVEPGFEGNDIDIFTQGDKNKHIITEYLLGSGYRVGPKFSNLPLTQYYDIEGVWSVVSFVNKDDKEIQLIVIVGAKSVYQYITNHFDLSCCITWWNAEADQFATQYPEYTLKKETFYEMYSLENAYFNHSLSDTYLLRMQKYANRGFKAIPRPNFPITLAETDFKEEIYLVKKNKLTGKMAFDVWEHDDVDCCKFLAMSPWNILLCIGDQYHAFNRQNLRSYMKEHTYNVPHIGKVYKTPFNQCVIDQAYYLMLYTDFTIFELYSEYTTQSSGWQPSSVSMFGVKCYTVKQWTAEVAGGIIVSPSKPIPVMAPLELLSQPRDLNIHVSADEMNALRELLQQSRAAAAAAPAAAAPAAPAALIIDNYDNYEFDDDDIGEALQGNATVIRY